MLLTFKGVTYSQWSIPIAIDTSLGKEQEDPLIAIGPNRKIVIVYHEDPNQDQTRLALFYSSDNGITFSRRVIPPPPVTPSRIVYGPDAIRFDSDGNLFVLWGWYEGDEDILYAHNLTLSKSIDEGETFTNVWNTRQPYPHMTSRHPFIIDENKTIHILWDSIIYTDPYFEHKYTKFLNGNFTNRIDHVLPYTTDSIHTEHDAGFFISNDIIHYTTNGGYPGYKAYYSRSSDGGTSFSTMVPVDSTWTFLVKSASERMLIFTYIIKETPPPRIYLGAKYIGDSTITFSPTFQIGSKSGYDRPSLCTYTTSNFILYEGADMGQGGTAYYEFENLENQAIDSAFFLNLKNYDFVIDSLGGKYFVAKQGKYIYFAKKDVITGIKNDEEKNQTSRNILGAIVEYGGASVRFSVTMREEQLIQLSLYDITGKIVAIVHSGYSKIGEQSILYNTSHLSSGIYFGVLKSGTNIYTTKFSLIH